MKSRCAEAWPSGMLRKAHSPAGRAVVSVYVGDGSVARREARR